MAIKLTEMGIGEDAASAAHDARLFFGHFVSGRRADSPEAHPKLGSRNWLRESGGLPLN